MQKQWPFPAFVSASAFADDGDSSAIVADIPVFDTSGLSRHVTAQHAAAAAGGSGSDGGDEGRGGVEAGWEWEAAAGPGPTNPFRGDWPH